MELTIISDFKELVSFIQAYKDQIATGEFGYKEKRLEKMPNIYETLNKWEEKNIEFLQHDEKELFYGIKLSIEKLMIDNKIETPESFFHAEKGIWEKQKVAPIAYN